jgi:hypothetical protein
MRFKLCTAAFLYLLFLGDPLEAGASQEKILRFEWNYEQPPNDISGFRLYRSDVSGGPYLMIVDIPWSEVADGFKKTTVVEAEDNTTSIKYFVLTAYDLAGNESINSNEVFTIIDFEAPGEPYSFTVTVVPASGE